ncbi:MAG: aspartyl protease family protein [Planctomycetota bacterium]
MRFEFPGCPPFVTHFDPETGYLARLETLAPGGEERIVTVHDEPRQILDLRVATRIRHFGADERVQAVGELVAFDIDRPVRPDFFDPPRQALAGFVPIATASGGRVFWAGVPSQPPGAGVPPEWQRRSAILGAFSRAVTMFPFIVDASLNGQHVRMLLDTGASRTGVLESAIDGLQLPVTGRETVDTLTGRHTVIQRVAGSLTLGGIAWYGLIVLSQEQPLAGPARGPIQGLLGMDLLYEHTLVLDPAKHSLEVLDRAQPMDSQGYSVLPLEYREGVPITTVSVDGTALRVLVDTGASATLIIGADVLESLGYASEIDHLPEYAAVTAKSELSLRCGRLGRLGLGDLELRDPIVQVAKHLQLGEYLAIQGLLGSELLSRLKVVLDPIGDQLLLAPADAWVDREGPEPGFVATAAGGRMAVISVVEGSPADRAGFKPGDVLVSVAGEKAGITRVDAIDVRLRGHPGAKLPIVVERGGENRALELEIELWPPPLARARARHETNKNR